MNTVADIRALIAIAQEISGKTKKPGRPKGKRSNPDFESSTLLLNRFVKRDVQKKLMRSGMDLSELTNMLLQQWVEQQEALLPKK